jgi:hypothetical protein
MDGQAFRASAKIGIKQAIRRVPKGARRNNVIDFPYNGPTVNVMGDKSPKANQKQAAQHQAKNAASKQKKTAESTAKQVLKTKK